MLLFVIKALISGLLVATISLIAKRNPDGAETNWKAVLAFLDRVAPRK